MRFSSFDASKFRDLAASDVENASEATSWTAGAKWILNPNARVVLNYVYTEFGNPGTLIIDDESEDRGNNVVLRAQYDY